MCNFVSNIPMATFIMLFGRFGEFGIEIFERSIAGEFVGLLTEQLISPFKE